MLFQNLQFDECLLSAAAQTCLGASCRSALETWAMIEFVGMKPSRHTCRRQCLLSSRTSFRTLGGLIRETSPRRHCRGSLNYICAIFYPSRFPIFAVLAPNCIARFFSLAKPCSPRSNASSLKSIFAGSTPSATFSERLSRTPHFCQTFRPRACRTKVLVKMRVSHLLAPVARDAVVTA